MKCRCCNKELNDILLDLNFAPLSNSYIKNPYPKDFYEKYYPLVVYYCTKCWFVQSNTFNNPKEIFNEEYAYLSSASKTFLNHCKIYVDDIIKRLNLKSNKSLVMEIASNDGYLLNFFNKKNIKNIGIEPTKSTANIAVKKGVNTINKFYDLSFSKKINKKYGKSDLIIANNVYAHVPDIINFTKGIRNNLKKEGVVTIEFPHFQNLLKNNLFDTIYHEHYSYLSLSSVKKIFQKCGLKLWHVEKISTQGGSLRVYGSLNNSNYLTSKDVAKILKEERKFGLLDKKIYINYSKKIKKFKLDCMNYLIKEKSLGKSIAIYGAAAKGNTFLNYLRISKDIIDVAFDTSKFKIKTLMPGSLIKIENPNNIKNHKPDIIIVLPWNLFDEIFFYLSNKINWNCDIIAFLPKFKRCKIRK